MVRIKTGVTPKNLVILAAAANTGEELGVLVTITSGTDGAHMSGSKHYTAEALDIRSKSMTKEQKADFLRLMRKRLGSEYQGFLEGAGQPNEHFHFEYDPPIGTSPLSGSTL